VLEEPDALAAYGHPTQPPRAAASAGTRDASSWPASPT
jgi:hypothetical protein